jgi:SAM-dependent methyltransferase
VAEELAGAEPSLVKESAASGLPAWLRSILACPWCKEELTFGDRDRISCGRCRIQYPRGACGQPDFRLTRPLRATVAVTYDPDPPTVQEALWTMPASVAEYLEQSKAWRGRPQADLVAWMLSSVQPDQIVVDLGGRSNRDEQLVAVAGGRYVGIDVGARDAMLLGDAHALPLRSESVHLVLSMSVFEHLKNPFLAASEIRRCLKPGGRLVGIVGFLEPVHGLPHGSYLHHSYLGIHSVLSSCGFTVNYLMVSRSWQAIHSVAGAMLPGLPRWVARMAGAPMRLMEQVLMTAYAVKSQRGLAAKDQHYRGLAAGVKFVATKAPPD